MSSRKTCVEIPCRDNGIWFGLQEIGWRWFGWLALVWMASRIQIGQLVGQTKRALLVVFSVGSTVVLWFSWKKNPVALSFAEAEYMVSSHASSKALWLHKLLVDLFHQELRPTVIYCDN